MRCFIWIAAWAGFVACAAEESPQEDQGAAQAEAPEETWTVQLGDMSHDSWLIADVHRDGRVTLDDELLLDADETDPAQLATAFFAWWHRGSNSKESRSSGVICYLMRDPQRPLVLRAAPDVPASRAVLALRVIGTQSDEDHILLALPPKDGQHHALPVHIGGEQRAQSPRRVSRVDWFNAPRDSTEESAWPSLRLERVHELWGKPNQSGTTFEEHAPSTGREILTWLRANDTRVEMRLTTKATWGDVLSLLQLCQEARYRASRQRPPGTNPGNGVRRRIVPVFAAHYSLRAALAAPCSSPYMRSLWVSVLLVGLFSCSPAEPPRSSGQATGRRQWVVPVTDVTDGSWAVIEVLADGTTLFEGEPISPEVDAGMRQLQEALMDWWQKRSRPKEKTDDLCKGEYAWSPARPLVIRAHGQAPPSGPFLALKSFERLRSEPGSVLLARHSPNETVDTRIVHFPSRIGTRCYPGPSSIATVDWFNTKPARPNRFPSPTLRVLRVNERWESYGSEPSYVSAPDCAGNEIVPWLIETRESWVDIETSTEATWTDVLDFLDLCAEAGIERLGSMHLGPPEGCQAEFCR